MIDPGYTPLHDYDRHPMRRPPTPLRPSGFGQPHVELKPSPLDPSKDQAEKYKLDLFASAMLEHFPDHDLTYSFKTEQFVDPKTNDMFKIWKLGQNK